mgnify:CR=1 FL=1
MNTENRNNVETQDVTWKTHNGGKNHGSPQAVNNTTIREEYTVEEAQRQRPLVPFLATRGGGYNEKATTSLSLSLSLSHTLSHALYKNLK